MIRGGKASTIVDGCSLNLFAHDELDSIHLATLEVLERTGIDVYLKEAQEIFAAAGARVNKENNRVHIPAYLVEDAIRSAPPTVVLCGRNPKNDIVLNGRRVGFTNFGAGVMIIDPFTGEHREPTKHDVGQTALICDALDTVDVYSTTVVARDVNEKTVDLHEAEVFLVNTSKHCMHLDPTNGKNARKYFEMAAAIVGGMDKLRERPIVSILACPVSPLQLHKETCEQIMECAKAGVPVNILPMGMAGATSPISLGGAMVTHNAEVVSGLVLHQLVAKGAPAIYGSATTTFDLTCTTAPVGAPELGLFSAGICELAHYYNLPVYVAGGVADSKLSDAQAGHEKTITALLPALAGANLMFGMGMLDLGVTFSYAQLMIDHDIAKMIKRAVYGIPVNDATLAADIINQVGPSKNFLAEKHTRQFMPAEQSKPMIIDRRMRGTWESRGGKDIREVANEEAVKILRTHKPEPLPDSVLKQLRSIVESAEQDNML